VLDCARVRPLNVEAYQKRDCAWASTGMCASESGERQTKDGVIQQGPRRSEVSIARMPVHKRARRWTSLDHPVSTAAFCGAADSTESTPSFHKPRPRRFPIENESP
jgi:hypothetical protein